MQKDILEGTKRWVPMILTTSASKLTLKQRLVVSYLIFADYQKWKWTKAGVARYLGIARNTAVDAVNKFLTVPGAVGFSNMLLNLPKEWVVIRKADATKAFDKYAYCPYYIPADKSPLTVEAAALYSLWRNILLSGKRKSLTVKYFADCLNVSRATIEKSIALLTDVGLLSQGGCPYRDLKPEQMVLFADKVDKPSMLGATFAEDNTKDDDGNPLHTTFESRKQDLIKLGAPEHEASDVARQFPDTVPQDGYTWANVIHGFEGWGPYAKLGLEDRIKYAGNWNTPNAPTTTKRKIPRKNPNVGYGTESKINEAAGMLTGCDDDTFKATQNILSWESEDVIDEFLQATIQRYGLNDSWNINSPFEILDEAKERLKNQ